MRSKQRDQLRGKQAARDCTDRGCRQHPAIGIGRQCQDVLRKEDLHSDRCRRNEVRNAKHDRQSQQEWIPSNIRDPFGQGRPKAGIQLCLGLKGDHPHQTRSQDEQRGIQSKRDTDARGDQEACHRWADKLTRELLAAPELAICPFQVVRVDNGWEHGLRRIVPQDLSRAQKERKSGKDPDGSGGVFIHCQQQNCQNDHGP